MKIYLSNDNNTNYEAMGYVKIEDLRTIDYVVSDSECTNIIIDGFLNQFRIQEVPELIFKLISKLRIGGEICIIENDIDLIANNYTRGLLSFMELNEHYFSMRPVYSFIRIEDIEEMLKGANLKVKSKQLKDNIFTIIYKREVGV